MRIIRRLQIRAAVLAIVAGVIVLVLALAFQEVKHAMRESDITGDIQSAAYDRSTLRNVDLTDNNQTAKEQWFAKNDEINALLKRAAADFDRAGDAATIDKLRNDQAGSFSLFSAIVDNRERFRSGAMPASLFRETESNLIRQLNSRSSERAMLITLLRESAEEHLFSSLRLVGGMLIIFIAAMTAAALIDSWSMARAIGNRIRRLRDGASVIGEGNLSYRIDTAGNDEFADLSESFNAMTEKLQTFHRELESEIAARRQTEKLLSENESRLKRSQEIGHLGSWELDVVNDVLTWSDEVYRIFGLRPGEFAATYEAFLETVHPDDRSAVNEAYSESLREGRDTYEIEHRIVRRPSGEVRHVHEKCEHIRDASGRIVRSAGMVQDITERKKAEETLKLTQFSVDHASVSAFLIGNDACMLYVNEQACRSLQYSREELLDMTIPDIDPAFHVSVWKDTWDRLKREGAVHFETMHRRKDGTLIPVEITANYVAFGGKEYNWAFSMEISERKRMEDEIRHLAHHDALTGLPNRRLFRDIINVELAQARRHNSKCAILFLDLDRFKDINDTLGHGVGDELLKQAAGLFRETIRASDTVARIGGDEFNITLADIVRPDDVSEIAQKILSRFRNPFLVSGNELNVTTSIGISVYPDDSTEIDALLRYADMAMYHAKESGRNTFRFYNPAINVRSVERMRMANMLRRSIAMGELIVYYQPQIDIKNLRTVSAEALVRWQHPEKGFLTPDRFLGEAEETGFITEIDEWVLNTVCAQVGAWGEAGLDAVCITVNLSVRQFEKTDLVNRIASILQRTNMQPGRLDLEVTETTAMSDVDRTARQLRQLRQMGIHVTIDDFGTGYSSLNYLKKLPIERLKIDKSFIRDIAHDPDDRAIISAVTSMARKMGLKTVAEGVETEEQLAFLRSTECDEAQGFLFSKPVSSQEFREMLM